MPNKRPNRGNGGRQRHKDEDTPAKPQSKRSCTWNTTTAPTADQEDKPNPQDQQQPVQQAPIAGAQQLQLSHNGPRPSTKAPVASESTACLPFAGYPPSFDPFVHNNTGTNQAATDDSSSADSPRPGDPGYPDPGYPDFENDIHNPYNPCNYPTGNSQFTNNQFAANSQFAGNNQLVANNQFAGNSQLAANNQFANNQFGFQNHAVDDPFGLRTQVNTFDNGYYGLGPSYDNLGGSQYYHGNFVNNPSGVYPPTSYPAAMNSSFGHSVPGYAGNNSNNLGYGGNNGTNLRYTGNGTSNNMYLNPMPAAPIAPLAPVAPVASGRRATSQPQYAMQPLAPAAGTTWNGGTLGCPVGQNVLQPPRIPSLYLPYEVGACLQAHAMAVSYFNPPVMGPPTTELPLHHPVPRHPIPRQIYRGPVGEVGHGGQRSRRGALVVTSGGSPVRTGYPAVPRKPARPPFLYPPNTNMFSIAGIPIFEDEDGEKEQEKENDEDQAANTLDPEFGNLRGGGAPFYTHERFEPVPPPFSPLSDTDTELIDRPATSSPDYAFWLNLSACADSAPGPSPKPTFDSPPVLPGPGLEFIRAASGSPTEIASSPKLIAPSDPPFAPLGFSPELMATSDSLPAQLDSSPKLMATSDSPSMADLTSVMSAGDSLMEDAQADITQGQLSSEPSFHELAQSFLEIVSDQFPQMMYVSGETGEPSVETTGIIEDIVRQQVVEILRSCTELAARRGSRSITINDLIFQIRDDAPKVSRLRTFLSWKDVRKNVKDSDDKGGEADLGAGEDPVGGVVPGGPVDDTAKKNKKAKVGLPWEPSSFYSVEVPEREDEEDEEEEEMNYITLQRLRKADERTKAMTREEYVTWSEFRQASFTYRKGKRFREWAGFGLVTDSKPSDDIVDILGFLTFEMVQTLTEEALKIKDYEDLLKERTGETAGTKKRKLAQGLFDPPSEGRTPVEPRHIQEAFRRLQQRPKKTRAMLNGTRLQQHTNLKLF